MTSELHPQPKQLTDPGAAGRRRADPGTATTMGADPGTATTRGADPGAAGMRGRATNADSPRRGDVSAETRTALEADPAGELGAAADDLDAQRSSGERKLRDLTDPKAMRALAHPVRMSLLELLDAAGTLTATQASELLGESPANCAFHLRTLAKYGFVREAGGGRGRERPWTRVQMGIRVSSRQEDPRASATAEMLQRVWLDRELERARNMLSSAEGLPDVWRDAQQASKTVEFLTPEEMRELGDEVHRLLRRYQDRQDDPSRRPDGALPVEFLFFGYPLIDLAGLAEQTREHDQSADRHVRPPDTGSP